MVMATGKPAPVKSFLLMSFEVRDYLLNLTF
jgi:hypothetical protein